MIREKIRASSLNDLAKCKDLTRKSDVRAEKGTNRHVALQQALKASDPELLGFADKNEIKKLRWAYDWIVAIVGTLNELESSPKLVIEDELSTTITVPLTTLEECWSLELTGHVDFYIQNKDHIVLIDLKWHRYDCMPQVKAYALMLARAHRVPVMWHVLFADDMSVDSGTEKPEVIEQEIIKIVADSDRNTGQWCTQCELRLNCKEFQQALGILMHDASSYKSTSFRDLAMAKAFCESYAEAVRDYVEENHVEALKSGAWSVKDQERLNFLSFHDAEKVAWSMKAIESVDNIHSYCDVSFSKFTEAIADELKMSKEEVKKLIKERLHMHVKIKPIKVIKALYEQD
jgi:HD-GYP domain-containing protein (c-di-GMP phosphodiesterase class II)